MLLRAGGRPSAEALTLALALLAHLLDRHWVVILLQSVDLARKVNVEVVVSLALCVQLVDGGTVIWPAVLEHDVSSER